MKKFYVLLTLATVCIAGMSSYAQAEVAVSGDVYAGIYNKYVFRGLDSSGNQWVSQFGADLSYKGFTLGYWSNLMTHQTPDSFYKAGEITETDITLNYAFTPVKLVTFNVGNIFYSLEGVRDTDELYAKATFNTILSPTIAMYWDCKQSNSTGLFYAFSVGHTFEVTKQLGLNLGALVSYNQANYSAQFGTNNNYSNWHDYEFSVSADYALTDKIKISPTYTYSNAISSKARDIAGVKDESVFGVKAAFNF